MFSSARNPSKLALSLPPQLKSPPWIYRDLFFIGFKIKKETGFPQK